MEIAISKGVEYVGIAEDKMKKVGEEMLDLRFLKANIRDQLQKENIRLKTQLQEKEEPLATMDSFFMEVIHYRLPLETYSMFLKDH